jgi:hypothetical protein
VTGPRILLAVAALAALLLWAALAGGRDEDLERGLQETDEAFARVEAELQALDPDFQALLAQGLVLGLREQHTIVRDRLADERARVVTVRTDPALDRRERLPKLRELVEQADETLALAVGLHRECAALVEHRRTTWALRDEARTQQGQIENRQPADGELATRAAALANGLTELAGQLDLAEQIIRNDTEQGRKFSASVASKLRQLVADQKALLRELP